MIQQVRSLGVGKARLTRFSVGCFVWASGLRVVGVWGFQVGGLYFCGFFLVGFCLVLGCLGFSFAWSSKVFPGVYCLCTLGRLLYNWICLSKIFVVAVL